MSTVTAKTEYTPEELLRMQDGDRYELVNGCLVEQELGARGSFVAGRLIYYLSIFCDRYPVGWVFTSTCSYQCFPHLPNQVRKPDVSFIRRGRLPGEQLPEGHVRLAPDLVVEVLSPNDLAYEVDKKVEEYRRAGVRLVWVINPETQTVLIYRQDGSISGLRETDELNGENVLPGFRCPVADLFRVFPTGPTANPNP